MSPIAVLCGGVGAARYLTGLVQVVPPAEVTAVVNTADDLTLHGLRVCPDLDTVAYTLAGAIDPERGWGLAGETWVTIDALERYGGPTWFRLGDRDLGTHLFRTRRLHEGAGLAAVTAEVAAAWGVEVRLLPMSEDPVATRVTLAGSDEEVSFQDYFVRLHHDVAVSAVRVAGAAAARPGPGVLDALTSAERVVVAPSNPVVSIGPVLAVPGVQEALEGRRASVVAVSPIIAGAALKGPADRLLAELGEEASVVGVARRYASFVGTLVVDEADADRADAVEAEGVRCVVAPTVMRDAESSAALARTTLAT